MKRLVVFTGAGISAESGLKTFRDSGGLWEEYNIEEVATPEAWEKNPELVLTFYNKRREQARKAIPNAAHEAIAKLSEKYHVDIITQNIDDLHERAGSEHVLHLHGEIMKSRSSSSDHLLYPIEGDLWIGDHCELGSQLRPHVVWFGEQVPEISTAAQIIEKASIVIIVGTSLNVYPAAGIVSYALPDAELFLVDPATVETNMGHQLTILKGKATDLVPELVEQLLNREG